MKLLPLRCPNCAQPLVAENDTVAVLCEQCYAAALIGDQGARQADLTYMALTDDLPATVEWRPFWLYHGRVHIHKRETQGGGGIRLFGSSPAEASRQLWDHPRYLYAPAWNLDVKQAQAVGSRLAQEQPAYQPVEPPDRPRLAPAVWTPEDGLKLLEFIVLAIEARRDDMLKNLEFSLELGPAQLIALPAD